MMSKFAVLYLVLSLSILLGSCTFQNREILQETAPVTSSLNSIQSSKTSGQVWFVKEQGANLVPTPVKRAIDREEPIKDSVNQLLAGPTKEETAAGVKSEIPAGTVLFGVEKRKDTVELNLSKRFAVGGIDSIQTRLTQLERTVKQCAGAKKVYLNVDGKRLLTAGDGLEIKQPLN